MSECRQTETGKIRLFRLREVTCSLFNELKSEGGYERDKDNFLSYLLKCEHEQQAPVHLITSNISHLHLDRHDQSLNLSPIDTSVIAVTEVSSAGEGSFPYRSRFNWRWQWPFHK